MITIITAPKRGLYYFKDTIERRISMGRSGRDLGDTEKINLFVPGDIYEIIEYDIRMFEVYNHKKTTPNKNKFINMIIKGYGLPGLC